MTIGNVSFEIHTPLDGERIADHIAHACSLGLPEADSAPLKHLTIIANGPSARLFDVRRAGCNHHEEPIDTLAVNGALKLFTDQGQAPTYWACCDPQELVADFIPDDPPRNTTYLVASKAHASVFRKLRDRDLRLWHINDHPIPQGRRAVACASSVTLCALSLMRGAFGYRVFDTYGWDACYEGLQHHASERPLAELPQGTVHLKVGTTVVDDEFVGGRSFYTTTTWAAEAQDAMIQLHHSDYQVNIHGDGLIKAIRESMKPRGG